jgi:hypothetical protein
MFQGKRETIIHHVGDEPITVTQADGSELTVPPRTALAADLPSELDIPKANWYWSLSNRVVPFENQSGPY